MSHSPFPWSTHPQVPSAVFDADGRRINEAWSPPAEATAWLIHWGDVVPEFTRDIRQAERGRRCGCNVEEFYAASPPSPIAPETAADNAALIAAIPAMITLLSEMALHFEMASSGFIGGCKSDQVWREKQDELIAEARVLASIGKTP